jgi:hypothetical protein
MGEWNTREVEYWSTGVLEYWENQPRTSQDATILDLSCLIEPTLHHSNPHRLFDGHRLKMAQRS